MTNSSVGTYLLKAKVTPESLLKTIEQRAERFSNLIGASLHLPVRFEYSDGEWALVPRKYLCNGPVVLLPDGGYTEWRRPGRPPWDLNAATEELQAFLDSHQSELREMQGILNELGALFLQIAQDLPGFDPLLPMPNCNLKAMGQAIRDKIEKIRFHLDHRPAELVQGAKASTSSIKIVMDDKGMFYFGNSHSPIPFTEKERELLRQVFDPRGLKTLDFSKVDGQESAPAIHEFLSRIRKKICDHFVPNDASAEQKNQVKHLVHKMLRTHQGVIHFYPDSGMLESP